MIRRSCNVGGPVALSILVLALACSAAGAVTREVGPGKEYGDIAAAISASEDGDMVLVYPGTYTVYPATGKTPVLQYGGRDICVTSTDPTDPAVVASTIIELGPEDEYSTCYSIVRFTDGETRDAILRGFTIRNGFDPYYGAGVRIVDATPTIEYNVFQDNPGDGMGGAIYVRGDALIQNNAFKRNTAGFIGGGGIYVGGGAPIIRDNTFKENYAEAHASGIYASEGTPEIYRNHFEGNTGSAALRIDGDGASVHDNLFIRNTGTIGAAVVLYGTCDFYDNQVALNRYITNGGLILTAGTPTVRNNVIAGNAAFGTTNTWMSSGIRAQTDGAIIENNTIALNSVENPSPLCEEAAIHIWADCTIRNNIIAFNQGSYGIHVERGSTTLAYNNVHQNAQGGYSGIGDLTGTDGNIDVNPQFFDPLGGDFHLMSQGGRWNPWVKKWKKDSITSACIDVGDPSSDYSNEVAPNGSRINMGAYGNTAEASKPAPAPPVLTWAGTPGCETDGVRPNTGQKYDLFAFKVKYTDPAGLAPQYCRVVITRNGSAYKTLSMRRVSGSVTAGRINKAEVRLPTGEYTYRFEGASAVGAAAGDPTAEMDGPVVEWPRQSRPDGLVWDGSRWLGDNIYNTTGTKQRVNEDVERGAKIAYTIKVQNDRTEEDALIVKGPAATGNWRFTYLTAAGAEITGAVTGAGWSTGPLAAGASTRIKLRMEALSSASIGATKAVTVRVGRASWGPAKYGEQADAVKCNSTVVAGATGTLQLAGLSAVPTTKGAQVTFSLSAPASVQARVLNLAGRPVKTLCTARSCEAGANTLVWNATSDAGVTVPRGTYLIEVTARTEGGGEARALVRLRLER